MNSDQAIRNHLVALLQGGQAFETFEDAIADFDPSERGTVPTGAEHSAWQILEHMSLALDDILEFIENKDGSYKEKNWPADYWPKEVSGDWNETVKAIQSAIARMEKLVMSEGLYTPFPWGDGQTLLREAMLVAEHQAYHIGELVMLKRWLAAAG